MSTKTDNAAKARKWIDTIENDPTWAKLIADSVSNTEIWQGELFTKDDVTNIKKDILKRKEQKKKTIISVVQDVTYMEILNSYVSGCKDVAVLNFASFFNCGGGFLKGSIAQEESLCHVSGLYSVLNRTGAYQLRGDNEKIPPEYYNELIYSQDVPFTVSEDSIKNPYLVDVITIASPNCNRVPIARYNQYIKVLRRRIEAIFLMPQKYGATKLILGAWGCGVFKNDPKLIAQYFEETSQKYGQAYDEIVYAIPNETTFSVFENIITKGYSIAYG